MILFRDAGGIDDVRERRCGQVITAQEGRPGLNSLKKPKLPPPSLYGSRVSSFLSMNTLMRRFERITDEEGILEEQFASLRCPGPPDADVGPADASRPS
jgi:hypothetical protein